MEKDENYGRVVEGNIETIGDPPVAEEGNRRPEETPALQEHEIVITTTSTVFSARREIQKVYREESLLAFTQNRKPRNIRVVVSLSDESRSAMAKAEEKRRRKAEKTQKRGGR